MTAVVLFSYVSDLKVGKKDDLRLKRIRSRQNNDAKYLKPPPNISGKFYAKKQTRTPDYYAKQADNYVEELNRPKPRDLNSPVFGNGD